MQKTQLILEREREYRSRILEMHKVFLRRCQLSRELFHREFGAE